MDPPRYICTVDAPKPARDPTPPGTGSPAPLELPPSPAPVQVDSPKPVLQVSQKGIENAKKRLRAFSIQKKSPMAGAKVSSPKAGTSAATVVIGKKLSTTKVVPKALPKPSLTPDYEELKKPKPPKPGNTITYMELKKKTLTEINDMKRKMELVELGIPLGLICPAANSPASKAMPTKAMPPIKSFLAPEQLDEIISEAKRARAEGRVFKFDYSKLLPDYDNPFLNKKKEEEMAEKMRLEQKLQDKETHVFKPMPKKEDWIKRRRDKEKDRIERIKERREKSKEKLDSKTKSDTDSERSDKPKETDVNLNDYLVCDSWSIDNEDKTDTNSPAVDIKKLDKEKPIENTIEDQMTQLREGLMKTKQAIEENIAIERKKEEAAALLAKKEDKDNAKIEKLKPVIDSFTYEIDVDDDEPILDMFHEDSNDGNSNKITKVKNAPIAKDTPDSKETDNSNDFLESIISEIKQEVEPEGSLDKCLVAYDPSGSLSGTPQTIKSGSETPDLDDKARSSSRHSNYSETSYKTSESGYKTSESGYKTSESGYKTSENGYKTSESGYKTSESGYKSSESGIKSSKKGDKSPKIGRKSVVAKFSERDAKTRDISAESVKSRDKSTDSVRSLDSSNPGDTDVAQKGSQLPNEESLETWSFVMKICQPLLFRHDRNKCYRETKAQPRVWFTENPKLCSCVKDRSIVYEELERCKMTLVDKLYLSDNVTDQGGRNPNQWYPESNNCLQLAAAIHLSSEWETEEPDPRLHQEYQRFMESVWPDIADPATGSTTPTRDTPTTTTTLADQPTSKHKKRHQDELVLERKPKRLKVASQDWSQDSEIDEEEQKSSKKKSSKVKDKSRKRKRSVSPDSNSDVDKGKTKGKKKDMKKLKAKMAKQRRIEKKYLKKLKDKQKKEKKNKKVKIEKIEVDSDIEADKEIQKKPKKKKKKLKKGKLKKRDSKKKRDRSSSSDSSSSDSDSDSNSEDKEHERKKQRAQKKLDAKKKKEKRKKKRKQSTSESAQSEEHATFDVNILNNIKTEKVEEQSTKTTDLQEFSPRRQQLRPRQEIINMKELQNDLGCRNLDIKREEAAKESPRDGATENNENESVSSQSMATDDGSLDKEVKEKPQAIGQPIKSLVDDSNQSISQESISVSLREQEGFEPDTSHLRPSSQNSNYSFHDVLNQRDHSNYPTNQTDYQPTKNQPDYTKDDYSKNQNDYSASQNDYSTSQNDYSLNQNDYSTSQNDYSKGQNDYSSGHGDYKEIEYEKDSEGLNEVMGNYEMYEEMAMEYQNNVASQSETSTGHPPLTDPRGSRIETVVSRGEIKCDWRAGDAVRTVSGVGARPSRWGLKPGEANIVLTGQSDPAPVDQVYPIRSVLEDSANYSERRAAKDSSYDEAYNALFGASDRLEYGDCFPPPGGSGGAAGAGGRGAAPLTPTARPSTLHQRIEHVLQTTVLGEVASAGNDEADQKEDKGILLNKSATESSGTGSNRVIKRVSFADGYKPGQDSDTESPPKKKRRRRVGCAWPCPLGAPDHVPLWDALPPPPPPPGSPPPRPPVPHCPVPTMGAAPPRLHGGMGPVPNMHHMQKIDPMVQLPGLLADPPPGMMSNMPQLHHHMPM